MPAPSLVIRVRRALERSGVDANQRLGIACSGGPDSVALAHATLALRSRGLVGSLTMVHVDHELRPESGEDATFVTRLADTWACACVVVRACVDRTRSSLERAAREARYRVFEQVIAERALDWMLLAHTASDQSETVLMRVIRGTGVVGLVGIPAVRGRYLRPLIDVERTDIEAYLDIHGVSARMDPSNRDPAFFRNRVRYGLLPVLREENPRVDDSLRRLASAAEDHRAVLEYAVAAVLERARRADGRLDVTQLRRAPASVIRHALACAVREALGDDADRASITAQHLQSLQALVARPTSGTSTLDLPRVRVWREYDAIHFEPRAVAADRARESPVGDSGARMEIVITGPDSPYDVRLWRPGDRMRPKRLRGRSRKLSDLYIDAKIPRRLRSGARVVVRPSDGAIEWAEYIGAAWHAGADVTLTSPDPGTSNRLEDKR